MPIPEQENNHMKSSRDRNRLPMKMSIFNVNLCFLLLVLAHANGTPVLIWSPSRPLSDLPQSYVGETVTKTTFYDNYLKPLTSNSKHLLVVFIQDKLSIEDFTNYADVYNPDSDGGAFRNVKAAMDDQFSVQIPAVANPMSAIDKLTTSFAGRVMKVHKPKDIAGLQLKDTEAYVILVTLAPVHSDNEFQSFKANDETIGKYLVEMNKLGISYCAIYTAVSLSKVASEETRSSRHLLQYSENTIDFNGSYWYDNVTNLKIYLRDVNLTITKPPNTNGVVSKISYNFLFENGTKIEAGKNNDNISLSMNLTNSNGSLHLGFVLERRLGNWLSTNGFLSFMPDNNTELIFNNMPIEYQIEATEGFSYHCSMLSVLPEWSRFKTSDVKNKTFTIALVLNKFQIEAFNNNTNGTVFSGEVWDCVQFFTIPIWMALFSSVILLMVLFFGVSMIANISTMDRFDDPRGKTITVTVNE